MLGGEEGAAHVLGLLAHELDTTMGMLGARNLSDLRLC
ncbi:alpha-hydroxy-acid oxidizing protein [Bosea sp. LjRoot9]